MMRGSDGGPRIWDCGIPVNPRWWVQGEKIYFRFRGQGSGPSLWVSSAKPKPWGVRLFLSSSRSPDTGSI